MVVRPRAEHRNLADLDLLLRPSAHGPYIGGLMARLARWLCIAGIAVALTGCGSSSSSQTTSCSGSSTLCGDTCVNTRSDNANCGACGAACAPGQVCSAGQCALTCQS